MSESRNPFLPKTDQMSEVDVKRAHDKATQPHLSAGAADSTRRSKRGLKDLVGAAVLMLVGAGTVHKATERTEELSISATSPRRKVPTDIALDSAPWISVDGDAEKQGMTEPGRAGAEARSRSRRMHTWQMYVKSIDPGQVVDRVSGSERDRIIYRSARIEQMRTNILEKIGPQFSAYVTERAEEACRGIILDTELPKEQEEAALVIDIVIERVLRLSYLEAQTEGWKGVNLMVADTIAMQAFGNALQHFIHDHPEFAARNYSVLFGALRVRADQKCDMESEVPDLRRAHTDQESGIVVPEALPETEALALGIAQNQFEVLGEVGEIEQLKYLASHPRDIRLLAVSHLDWFEDRERKIRRAQDLREIVVRELSYLLDRGQRGVVLDDGKHQRIFELRSRLLRNS